MKSVTMGDMVALADVTVRRIHLEERLRRLPMTVKRHDELIRRLARAVRQEREAQERLRRVLSADIDDAHRPYPPPAWLAVPSTVRIA